MGIGTIRVVAGVLVAALALSAVSRVKAAVVPEEFRIYNNYANVAVLADYNDIPIPNRSIRAQPQGSVTFSDGNDVPEGWKLWFLDQGQKPENWPSTPFYPAKQVIGITDILPGGYNFRLPYDHYIYGDKFNPPDGVDEGAQEYEPITILAQDPNNKFYECAFISGPLMNGFQFGRSENDITVCNPNELPNHNAGWRELEKIAYWWLSNDCNDVVYWSGIDPNFCYCEEMDADWDGDIDFIDFAHFARFWHPNDSSGVEMAGYDQSSTNNVPYGTSGVGVGEVGGYVGATQFRVYGPDGDEDLGSGYAPVGFGLPPRRKGELVEARVLD